MIAQQPVEKVKLSSAVTSSSLASKNTSQPTSSNRDSLWLNLLPSFPAYAQSSHPKFKRLTPNEGLSQGHVTAIIKDRKGFMWFGTDEGLNKYDGYTFTAYKYDAKRPESISNNMVRDVIEDNAGNVWVATTSGLDKFKRKEDAFVHYTPGERIYIEGILEDSQNRIWIGSNKGLYLFRPDKGTFHHYPHGEKDANALRRNYIYHLVEDNQGDLWLGTQDGLSRFNTKSQEFTEYRHDANDKRSIGSDWVIALHKDSKGRIWAGTLGGGISLFDNTKNSFTNFYHDPNNANSLAHNDVLSIVESNDGKLWIGTENGGISVFDYEKNKFVTYQYDASDNTSLSNNSVHCLYKDDIGNIWAGTWSGGVNFLPRFGDKFAHYKHVPNNPNSLSHNIVTTITGDMDGNIWMGTDGGGFNLLDGKKKTFVHYQNNPNDQSSIKSNYILVAANVNTDILALGYHRFGFDLLNRKTGQITHLPEKAKNNEGAPLASTSGTAVCKDLWFGTYYNFGLFHYNLASNRFTRYQHNPLDKNSISEGSIFSLLEDRDGNVWIGMGLNSGVDFFDRKNNRFIHHRHNPRDQHSISGDMVFSIMEDHQGNIWLGTGNGLNCYDKKTKRFRAYTEKDGLANNVIYGILEDKHGNLWLSSNKGISKFNPVTKACRNYDVSDGLQDNTFKQNAWYQTAKGEMFFGGINGFNVFHPDSIHDNPFVPPVYITDLQIFNKSVSIGKDSPLQQHVTESKEITLSYEQSVFTFAFAALNYTRSEKNQYAYKLEGFDKDWNYVAARRTATYTNLDAGDYTFRVKASNNDGVWNEQGATLTIRILPPWWRTWWAKLAAILLLTGSAVSFYRLRIRNIKRQNKMLELQVYKRTEELAQQNEELIQSQEEISAQRDIVSAQNQELQTAREIIEKQNKEIIIRNETLEAEVEERTHDLVEYNQQLEQFAFISAHSLRAPVARILGLGNILNLNNNDLKEARMIVDKITVTTEELDRVVTDLNKVLDMRRNSDSTIVPVNLEEEMRLIKINMEKEIQDTKAIFIEDFSKGVTLWTVKPHFDSILLNLISNAIKYRHPNRNPVIRIHSELKDNHFHLTVQDNGLGMDLELYKDKVFTLYHRFHLHIEGKGLGLFLVKTQLTLMGGKIDVASIPNEGTTFYLSFKHNPV